MVIPWITALGTIGCLGIFLSLYRRIAKPKEFAKLAGPKPTSLLLGNIYETKGTQTRWKENGLYPEPFRSWTKQYGEVFYIREGLRHGVMMMDPRAVHHVLVTNMINYPRDPHVEGYLEHILYGKGLMSSHGRVHDQYRKILNPLFTPKNIKSYISLFEGHARRFCNNVLAKASEKKSTLNLLNELNELTLDIIGLTGFGYNIRENSQAYNAYNEFRIELNPLLVIGLFTFPKLVSNIPLESLRRRRQAHENLRNVMTQIIDNKLKNTASDTLQKDLLDLLLPHSTPQQALIHTMTLLTGGHETTTSTLTWTLTTLSKHPEVLKRVRQEISSVLAKYGSFSTWEAVADLRYLLATIRETLRMNSIAKIVSRVSTSTDQVPLSDGTTLTIPKNTLVSINNIGLCYSSRYWTRPDKFIPDRFYEGSTINQADMKLQDGLPLSLSSFLFSAGAKRCIGERFAMAEIQVILATVINEYDIVLSENSNLNHNFNGMVLQPTNPEVYIRRIDQARYLKREIVSTADDVVPARVA